MNACGSQARASLGQEFSVSSGVQQGCIAASLLFNVFFDFVVRDALNNM
jgi:hypothetical protein